MLRSTVGHRFLSASSDDQNESFFIRARHLYKPIWRLRRFRSHYIRSTCCHPSWNICQRYEPAASTVNPWIIEQNRDRQIDSHRRRHDSAQDGHLRLCAIGQFPETSRVALGSSANKTEVCVDGNRDPERWGRWVASVSSKATCVGCRGTFVLAPKVRGSGWDKCLVDLWIQFTYPSERTLGKREGLDKGLKDDILMGSDLKIKIREGLESITSWLYIPT